MRWILKSWMTPKRLLPWNCGFFVRRPCRILSIKPSTLNLNASRAQSLGCWRWDLAAIGRGSGFRAKALGAPEFRLETFTVLSLGFRV